MSRNKLVDEYVDGNLSRRKFIHGLVGLGVGVAAAVAFADTLTATAARAVTEGNDIYPSTSTTNTTSPDSTTSTTSSDSTTTTMSSDPTIALGATTVEAGGTVSLTGQGFAPESDATIDLHSDPVVLAKLKTDASGKFTTTLSIPSSTQPGMHKVEVHGVKGTGAVAEVSADLMVLAAKLTPSNPPASVSTQPRFTG